MPGETLEKFIHKDCPRNVGCIHYMYSRRIAVACLSTYYSNFFIKKKSIYIGLSTPRNFRGEILPGATPRRQGQYLRSEPHPPTLENTRKSFGPLVFGHEVGYRTGFFGSARRQVF